MRSLKQVATSIFMFVFLSSLLTMAVWFFFGKITVVATFDGSKMTDAIVQVDDEVVCKKTPCSFHPMPGHHVLTIHPPEDYETAEPVVAGMIWSRPARRRP
ncbi:MAG: hypothetical protein WC750_04430 [Patescibacteria group bacterium]|jgi:hypothetical protein